MARKVKTLSEEITGTASIEIVLTFGVGDIDDSWHKGEYGLAVLKAAIDVETILFYHLLNALSSNRPGTVREKVRKEIKKWALGRYVDWCTYLELFSENELKNIQPLVEERNDIAHERGYIDRGKTDLSIKEKWKEAVKVAKEFIQAHGRIKVE